uniref:CTD small phosphatase like n=1 Tax=Latimeria chalumnae TaxID=7897 RepID=H3A708_LATCH
MENSTGSGTTSIITQVSKNGSGSRASSVGEPDDSKRFAGSQSSSAMKKQRSRSIFSSLLCCFSDYDVDSSTSDSSAGGSPICASLSRENGVFPKPPTRYLLPERKQVDYGKKCMVIDLDETLVHSSFKSCSSTGLIIPSKTNNIKHEKSVVKQEHIYLHKKPVGGGGDLFCILLLTVISKYADPVADLLDQWGIFRARLFREACVFHKGNYVKDLSRLGRDLSNVIIVDNSPASYIFHPENAVPVESWFDDLEDTELLDLIPFLEILSKEDEVYSMIQDFCNR